MIEHMKLTALERWAVSILSKSDHIGLLVVKELNSQNTYVVRDQTDCVPLPNFGEEAEPSSMEFERMYHSPSYGEME